MDICFHAESLFQRALQIRERALGPHHPDVADSFSHLARSHQMRQQPVEALSLYQQALEIREQALGPHHPKTVATRTAYTHLLQEMEQTEALSGPTRKA